MKVENVRRNGRDLLFNAIAAKGDLDVTVLCDECVLNGSGCSREIDPKKRKISGRINLDSRGAEQVNGTTNATRCGIDGDVEWYK